MKRDAVGISAVFIIFMAPMIVFSLAGNPAAEGEEAGATVGPEGESAGNPDPAGSHPEIAGPCADPTPIQVLFANRSDAPGRD